MTLHTEDRPTQTVWDLPVRLFHWSLVVSLGVVWWSGEQHRLDVHRLAGYSIMTLVLFRVAWGFFGSTSARFASFLKGPVRVRGYIRHELFKKGNSSPGGHNPLGGWSVVALLGTLLLQTLFGLVAVDIDGLESGPLAHLVSFDAGRIAAQIHGSVFNGLLVLTALHVIAIAFYHLYKKQNLTGAMIYGDTRRDSSDRFSFAGTLRAAGLLLFSAVAVAIVVQLLGR